MARRRFWIGGGLVVVAAAAAVGVVVFWPATKSTVFIQNDGDLPVDLAVTTANPGFEWRGRLAPGQAINQVTSFGDNSFSVTCVSAAGSSTTEAGYVTSGMSFEVTVAVKGCEHVVIDTIPSA